MAKTSVLEFELLILKSQMKGTLETMKRPIRNTMWEERRGFWAVRLSKGIHGPYAVVGGRYVPFTQVVWC